VTGFKGAKPRIISEHTKITISQMKEIGAACVRELRKPGHELPHNREQDKRYQSDYDPDEGCQMRSYGK